MKKSDIPKLLVSDVEGYLWKTECDFTIQTNIYGYEFSNGYLRLIPNGKLVIHRGYCWDGSTIPLKGFVKFITFGWYKPDKFCKKASLPHDALCQAMREGMLDKLFKQKADELYRDMCILLGLPKWMAKIRFTALRKAGDLGIKPEPKGKESRRIYKV